MSFWMWALLIGGGYFLYQQLRVKPDSAYRIEIPPFRIPIALTETQFQEVKSILQSIFQVKFTPKLTDPTGVEYKITISLFGFQYTYTGLHKMTKAEMAKAAFQYITSPQKLTVTREANAILITIPPIAIPKA